MFESPDLGIVTIVQARFNSTRLPGKALKALGVRGGERPSTSARRANVQNWAESGKGMRSLAGRPLLSHVLERARLIGFPTCLATSDLAADDALARLALSHDIPVWRGSEWDVLARIAGAARDQSARIVIRVTGDCPLLCPDVARAVVELYCKNGGIATNDTSRSGWPDGLDVEVFTAWDLYEAEQRSTSKDDREHVTPWIRRHRSHAVLRCNEDWSRVKLSVDTADDLERVRAVLACGDEGVPDWPALRAAMLAWDRSARRI